MSNPSGPFEEIRFRRATFGPAMILRVVEHGVSRDATLDDIPVLMRQMQTDRIVIEGLDHEH